jgi:D-aminopeptidase
MASISKKRFRDYGFNPGLLDTGKKNNISDVAGVLVGHFTKVEDDICTGVTIIDPGIKDLYAKKLPASIVVGNGAGKVAGSTQVEEFGTIEAPIALTNTLAVGPVTRGVVDIVLGENPDMIHYGTVNVVVGEINDGRVNNIHRDSISKEEVQKAYEDRSSDIGVGDIGAGAGARAFSWKGGIGSASRLVQINGQTWTLGALVQTNSGGALTIMGVPIGTMLGKTDFEGFIPKNDGSCTIVFAIDAPLSARQLKRIAARAFMGLARTGSVLAHASGDYASAFSTSRAGVEGSGEPGPSIEEFDITPLFLAAAETVEESVYDALFMGNTVVGKTGITLEALSVDAVVKILKEKL